ncbi:hypothetical protein [Curtobacterium flaccumfaciens]|uniref:hypothetical protein n=1 Tax=Curtobacterium flaccumfaciens TaxID=2035 RepID=UPI00112B78DD|nr:hypothetical protein [Curtobacterium flaccumfaciens]
MTDKQTQLLSKLNGGDCLPLLESNVYRADRHGSDDIELDFLVNYGRAVQQVRDRVKGKTS